MISSQDKFYISLMLGQRPLQLLQVAWCLVTDAHNQAISISTLDLKFLPHLLQLLQWVLVESCQLRARELIQQYYFLLVGVEIPQVLHACEYTN